jgi:hypothetical protein
MPVFRSRFSVQKAAKKAKGWAAKKAKGWAANDTAQRSRNQTTAAFKPRMGTED